MAVSSTIPVISYTANGSATTFSYPFLILKASDLKVFFDSIEVPSGFSVTGVGTTVGGDVVFDSPPANGVVVKLLRRMVLERTTDFIEGGALRANVLDSDFDRAVMMIQDARADAISLVEFEAVTGLIEENVLYVTTKADEANASALAAAASASSALSSASDAGASASTATTQAGIATTQAGIATTQAGIATAGANTATAQATTASTAATTATTQAGIATTGASTATTQAGIATTAATSAQASALAAEGFAADAEAAADSLDTSNLVRRDNVDQTIEGVKTFSNPVLFPISSISLPGIAFDGDINSGLCSVGSDIVGIATGGEVKFMAAVEEQGVRIGEDLGDSMSHLAIRRVNNTDGFSDAPCLGITSADPMTGQAGDLIIKGMHNEATSGRAVEIWTGYAPTPVRKLRIPADGAIESTVQIAAPSFNATSSRRIKSNIREMCQEYVDRVALLEPVQYTRKADGKEDFGFIAEDVADLYPEVIHYDSEGQPMAIDYSRLTAVLAGAFKGQQDQITALRKEVDELKSKR